MLYEIATGKDRHAFPALPTVLNDRTSDTHLLELKSVLDRRGIALWDVTTGEQIEILPIPGWSSEHTFSPDGRMLGVDHGGGEIRLVNLVTKAVHLMTNHTGRVSAIAFSTDGKIMVSTAFSREIVVWNTADGKALSVLRGPEKLISSLAFAPDGKTFATGSKDGTIRFWGTNSVPQARIDTLRPAALKSISDDGTHVATFDTNGPIRILSSATMQEKARIPISPGDTILAISNEAHWLATRTGEGRVLLWDMTRMGDPFPALLDTASAFAGRASFSPDRTRLVVLESNSVLCAYSPPERQRIAAVNLKLDPRDTPPRILVHSPDGRFIATADRDGLLSIIDTSTWHVRETFSPRVADCRDVAIAPDNQTKEEIGRAHV